MCLLARPVDGTDVVRFDDPEVALASTTRGTPIHDGIAVARSTCAPREQLLLLTDRIHWSTTG